MPAAPKQTPVNVPVPVHVKRRRSRSSEALRATLLLAIAAFADGACKPPPAPTVATPASSSPTTPAPTSSTQAVGTATTALDDAYLAMMARHSPESATALGMHEHDDLLDTRDESTWVALMREEEAWLDEAEKRISWKTMSPSERMNLELARRDARVRARRHKDQRPFMRNPSAYTSVLSTLFSMVARDYAPAADRATKIVQRVDKIPALLALGEKQLESPPAVWTRVAIDQAGSANEFLIEVEKFVVNATPELKRAPVSDTFVRAREAFAHFKTYLEREKLPRGKDDFAAGREPFDFLLSEHFCLQENTDAVRALGERIFKETEAKMTEVAKKIDPKATGYRAVVKKIKGRHPSAAELLPSYRREVARAREFMIAKNVVEAPAGEVLEVIDTPVFQRTTTSAAYDAAPPFDPPTKGFFFVTPVSPKLSAAKQDEELREHDFGDIVDTAVHEAYPGHHLQGSYARVHPSKMRRVFDASTFSEGWALYTEELYAELGYYTPEERLMQLEWALVRAARVMIDVDLHTRGMTFEAAVAFLVDRVGLERPLATSEVKRYTMSPTQPLSYVVGREEIFALRARAKATWGEKYSLAAFHKELLSHGTIPVSLVAREIWQD